MTKRKDAYYFSHDANARNDFKILRLRRTLGLEGYGIYFCLVEMLREQKDFTLLLESLVDFAYTLDTSEEKVKAVVLNFGLFEIDENRFFSLRLIDSMNEYKCLTQKRIEAGKKGGQASVKQRLSKRQPNVNDCSTIKVNKSKVKEMKLNEIKLNEIKLNETKEKEKEIHCDFVLLTSDQHKLLIEKFGEEGTKDRINNLNNYAHQKPKKFKEYDSHYHTILAWERKADDNKPKENERPWEIYGLTEKQYYEGE